MSDTAGGRPYDVVVVGAGILGLATARALLEMGPALRLLVLEKEPAVGRHQSSHNSGVIHAGLYYKPGSGKARLCREGADAMVRFCRDHGVAHEICGKVVVALSSEELPRLEELERRGTANGVPRLRRMGPDELREIEPHAGGIAALHSPTTGIVDYPAVTGALARLLVEAGAEIRLGAELTGVAVGAADAPLVLRTASAEIRARFVVNCAGLHCDRIAGLLGAPSGVRIIPFRGEYYVLRPERASLVRTLIYPVPDPAFPFLGVHFTRGIHGEVEAGPNAVLALKREGYRRTDFNLGDAVRFLGFSGFRRMASRHWRTGLGESWRSFSKPAFVRALQRLLPDLKSEDLVPGGAGVRAQAVFPDGRLADDFHFEEGPRSLHVLNAPSPGATASLAIGREIARRAAPALGLDARV